MTRLLILQPYLTQYRVPFFERLDGLLAAEDIELMVGVGTPGHARGDAAAMGVATVTTPDRLGGYTRDRVRWRRLDLAATQPDLIITEFAGKNLESWPLLGSRRRVALWGHIGGPRLDKKLRLRMAEWFFAYTEQEAQRAAAAGFPAPRITAVGNTTDTATLTRELRAASAASVEGFRRDHGLTAGHTALFLGGVDEGKGISYLLDAARAAGHLDPAFRWVVAGAGDHQSVVVAAREAGFPVVPVGRVTGSMKALVLIACDVIAMPSAIGLVAVDALVAGKPVVTRAGAGHGPEVDYLDPDRHLVEVQAATSPAQFAESVVELLGDPERLSRMSAACSAEAPSYSIDGMARRFADGVLRWASV